MEFLLFICMALVISAAISAIIALLLLRKIASPDGRRYWLYTCVAVPSILIAYSVYLLVSFVPPSPNGNFDPMAYDPGPANFLNAVVYGVILPLIYLIGAIPTSWLLRRRRFSK